MKHSLKKIPCFRCGVCCRKYQVRLTRSEIAPIARQLKISEAEFIRKYTDPRWPGEASFLIVHRKGSCAFLNEVTGNRTTICSIHPYRPKDCRDWYPDINKSECSQGLALWNLSLDTEGNIIGSEDEINTFYKYLDSLKQD